MSGWVQIWQVTGVGYTEEVTLRSASAPAEREPDQDGGRHNLANGHARHSDGEEEDTNHRAKRARLSKDDGGGAGHLRAMNKVTMIDSLMIVTAHLQHCCAVQMHCAQ